MHSREAWDNRRRNRDCDHAGALIYGLPLKDNREGPKHFLVHPQHPPHAKDHVWGVIESNRKAAMAPEPLRRNGRRHFGQHRSVASRISPYGTEATPPEKIRPRVRPIPAPKGHGEHRPKKRTGYPQTFIHQNRNIAFGDFGPVASPHYGKGGYRQHDRKAIHDHLKVHGIVPETPTPSEIPHAGKKHTSLDKNRNTRKHSFDIITNQGGSKGSVPMTSGLQPQHHKRHGRQSLINHIVGDHATTLPGGEHLAVPDKAPPGLPPAHTAVRSGNAPHLKDLWLDNTPEKHRQHKLAVHDHNAEHIAGF